MWESEGGASSRRRQGSLEAEPQFLAILQFCNENNIFLGIFSLKYLLKNIFLISSIIQNC